MSKLSHFANTWKRQPVLLKWLYGMGGLLLLYGLMNWVVMPLYTRQYQAIQVPDVTKLSWEEAEQILRERGLIAVKGGEKYDENIAPGFVIFQNPGVELPVKKGRRVYLTLSKGRRSFKMPKLVGQSERDARFILEQEELALGDISYRSDPYYPDGVVCAQSIAPDEEVTIGTRVHLVVSLGSEPTEYIVPNVIGKSQNDAVHEILKAGLTLGKITEQPTDELLPYTVIGQTPPAGTVMQKGDEVHLVITVVPQ